ncbi:MAG: hypothetical protein HUU15_02200 [Candidatus Brocadiae bacterium]|nr:hypothetical protein [Candidatus Brocadiia bacterium]
MKRLSAVLAPVVALGIALHAASDDTARQTAVVAKGDLSLAVELEGAFESADSFEAKYRFDSYSGDLQIVQAAAHGAQVKKGAVLLKCDPAPWRKAVAAAENEFRGAEAALKAAEEAVQYGDRQDALSLKGSEDALRDAEKSLQWFNEMDGPHMLKMNDLWMKNSEDNVKDQEEELKQLEDMYKSEELTTETADIVRNRARRSLENAKTYLEMRRKESKKTPDWEHPRAKERAEQAVEAAKIQLASTKSGLVNAKVQRETSVVRARMERDRQADALSKLKADGDRLTITAPADGQVFVGQCMAGNWTTTDDLIRALRVGEKIAANQVHLTLVPSSGALSIRVSVPEDKVSIASGARTTLAAPLSNPATRLGGKVRSVSPIPIGGLFPAVIDLDRADPSLVPGMKCRVTLQGGDLKDVLLVPATAVGSNNGRTCVWTTDGKTDTAVEVALGATNGQAWEIRSGLKGGETILVNAPKK